MPVSLPLRAVPKPDLRPADWNLYGVRRTLKHAHHEPFGDGQATVVLGRSRRRHNTSASAAAFAESRHCGPYHKIGRLM
jgi:hypothetical protein